MVKFTNSFAGMRTRCFIMIVFGFLPVLKASAQELLTIRGIVYKKLSSDRLSQVLIRNLKSNDIMMSDELGMFTVKAAEGDTLLFTKQDYTPQRIVVVNGNDQPVYMQPEIKLATVTIQAQSTRQELNDVMAGYKKDGIFNNGKSLPLFSFLASPLTGLYNLVGTTPREARHFAAYSKAELEAAEVDRRYNAVFVKRVTNATDSTAKKFMLYYTPTYDDLKGWNDYDLMKQVKKRYDYYTANKDKANLKYTHLPALPKTDVKLNPGKLQ